MYQYWKVCKTSISQQEYFAVNFNRIIVIVVDYWKIIIFIEVIIKILGVGFMTK